MGIWLLLFILFGLGSCILITLIFGLLKAGKRADEAEEKVLAIILPVLPGDITAANMHTQCASLSTPISKISVAK